MVNRLRRLSLLAALLIATAGLTSVTAARPAHAYTTVDVSIFYDSLSPYGHWVDYSPYGWSWVPANVSYGWRPYSEGYWVYTDYGWTWESFEPWGWATYHYGRWVYDPFYGWVWVPGTAWAPAWVAWRADDDWIGWAPLPPAVGWNTAIGVGFASADIERIPSQRWCFVQRAHVIDRNLDTRIVPMARNVALVQQTRNETQFDVRGGRPFDRGVDVASLQRSIGHPVPRMKIVDARSPSDTRGAIQTVRNGGSVAFFRPNMRRAPVGNVPRPETRLAARRGGGAGAPMAAPTRERGRASSPSAERRMPPQQLERGHGYVPHLARQERRPTPERGGPRGHGRNESAYQPPSAPLPREMRPPREAQPAPVARQAPPPQGREWVGQRQPDRPSNAGRDQSPGRSDQRGRGKSKEDHGHGGT